MNEAELIARCLRKEKEAWDMFVRQYARLIYWAIRKRLTISGFLCDEDDIGNIFQDVFVSILEGNKLAQVKDAKFIPGWLSMVASNKTVDFMREKVRRDARSAPEPAVFKDNRFEQEVYDNDVNGLLKDIIEGLTAKEKIIISLNLLEERTHKEIGQILGMPMNTVSTIIARTKEKIKKELEKRGITG